MDQNFSRSLFLEGLIPQYIREEYPLFVSFLKEYYNYLDRKNGQFVAVKVTNGGKNYSNSPTISIQVIDNNPDSITYGEYITDFKGAAVSSYVVNGKRISTQFFIIMSIVSA